jgi:hypothetical protein
MPKRERRAALTAIGCPGCSGVLSEVDSGRRDHVSYVCMVGHSYSLVDLVEAKEQQLEYGLWSLLSLLDHLDIVYNRLLAQIDHGEQIPRKSIQARLQQVREHARRLRELVEQDEPPDLEFTDGETRAS